MSSVTIYDEPLWFCSGHRDFERAVKEIVLDVPMRSCKDVNRVDIDLRKKSSGRTHEVLQQAKRVIEYVSYRLSSDCTVLISLVVQ